MSTAVTARSVSGVPASAAARPARSSDSRAQERVHRYPQVGVGLRCERSLEQPCLITQLFGEPIGLGEHAGHLRLAAREPETG